MTEFWSKLLSSTELGTDSALITDLIIASRLKDMKEGAQFEYPGTIRDSIYFVRKGLVRSYFRTGGVEHTEWFYQQGDIILDDLALFHNDFPDTFFEASNPSLIIEIKKKDYLDLRAKHPLFRDLSNSLETDFRRNKKWHARLMQHVKGITLYELFIEKFPQVNSSVQVQHVASFLGVSKNTMTRYRNADLTFKLS